MATVTSVIDDLDRSPGATPVEFAIDGENYIIDLVDPNANELRTKLKPYITAGRKATSNGRTKRGGSTRASSGRSRDELKEIRQWAVDNGYNLSARGRVPQIVLDAWDNGKNVDQLMSTLRPVG